MNNHGNLVLGRIAGQSVFIGEGELAVKLTVVDSMRCTLNFQAPVAVDIKMIDSRTTKIILGDEEVTVTTVSTNGKTVKLAFQADKSVSIDREEIRLNKNK